MISLQIAASILCLFIDSRTWDMLLFTLSEFTTSIYRLQAAHFCVRVQESLSDIHPHTNPHPIIYHLLAFHLNKFPPTALLRSLIANNAAASLLVTSLMKPLMPGPWQLCEKEAAQIGCGSRFVSRQCDSSKAVRRMRSLPLSPGSLKRGRKELSAWSPVSNQGLMNGCKPCSTASSLGFP